MEKESFEIRDRRRFHEDAVAEEKQDQEDRSDTHSKRVQEEKTAEENKEEKKIETPLPEVTFSSFIFSLARSAFMHLGEEPHPETGKVEVSLPLAKETIDIISMLEEKTRGNLTPEEDQLVKNMLFALRMKYVEIATKKSK